MRLFLTICLAVMGLTIATGVHAQSKKQIVNAEILIDACKDNGGTWRTFSNGCADTCYKVQQKNPMCPMAFRDSCDCGKDKCWDTGSLECVDNDEAVSNSE